MSAVGHSAFLQVAFDRFASPELRGFIFRWNIDLHEVESLKPTSAMILAFYNEAEVKQFTDGAVKLWLDHLKQLLYDAENILDEYATELLRLKLESGCQTHSHQTHQGIQRLGSEVVRETFKRIGLESEYQTQPHQAQQVRNPVSLNPSEISVSSAVNGINEKFGSKLRDVNERLKSVAQGGRPLCLNSSMGSGPCRVFSQKPPTSSLVNISKVFGRDDDMWKIIKWLLSDEAPSPTKNDYNNFSVLPIVGMGGVGKTTLAQLVYNHDTVKKHFGLKAWVCVSEDFNVVRLVKEILESATGSSPPSNSLDLLQLKLQEALREKRFLLVLDDVWNENHEGWEALRTTFISCRAGSKILVTTRNKGVSSVVRTVQDDHDLKGLSNEACLALVRRHASMDPYNAATKFEAFGKEIVNKCKGSPLAVKILAGLLLNEREGSEWKDILENDIWDLKESEILPSLMLSYHHLPPILKRCFAYCALFPKDYVFNKIELVLLWMAEGIVQSKGRKRPEDIGAGYFDELFMRSFFELSDRRPSNTESPFNRPSDPYSAWLSTLPNKLHIRSFFESSNNTRSGFVMHDLIHDLAQVVSGGIFCRREYDKPSEVLATTRHLSYDLKGKRSDEAKESHEAMKTLHTILTLNNALYDPKPNLPTMQFQFQILRVLCFKYCGNLELPDSIDKLKHLRLLDLSYSDILRLPNSLTGLYNLQTLILNGCGRLRELPEDMGNLINLRHLFLPFNDQFVDYKMPLGMGNITCLQTLNMFFVGSKNNIELKNLKDLPQLRGTLEILKLENAANNGSEAMVTSLKNKSNLLGLRLYWSWYGRKDSFHDSGRNEKVEEDVLNQLQPHTNLEVISIENYGGTRFPSWMEHPSFSNLQTMLLIHCLNCRFLPLLRQLPLLKHLVIEDCSATKMVGSELYWDGLSSANKQFRSLETLSVELMEEWEEWPEPPMVEEEEARGGGGQFPFLRVLTIKECPKLRMFSHRFPNLEKLEIENCHDLRELPPLLPSLELLRIENCKELRFLPMLPSIKELKLQQCQGMVLKTVPSLSSLRSFTIDDVSDLVSLPNGFMQHLTTLDKLTSLRRLLISGCPALVSIPKGLLPTSLEELCIRDCSILESIHDGLSNITSLQHLEMHNCPMLTQRYQKDGGEEWLKIAKIPRVLIQNIWQ